MCLYRIYWKQVTEEMDEYKKDKGLRGNEKIENYIAILKMEPSNEALAAILTIFRRRMQEAGQLVVSVEAAVAGGMQLDARSIKGKGKYFLAYTSFEEQMKGQEGVQSTFMAEMDALFRMVLQDESIQGIAINPWNMSFLLEREMIEIIMQCQEE